MYNWYYWYFEIRDLHPVNLYQPHSFKVPSISRYYMPQYIPDNASILNKPAQILSRFH